VAAHVVDWIRHRVCHCALFSVLQRLPHFAATGALLGGGFCCLAGCTVAFGWPGWTTAIAASLVATLVVLTGGTRAPDYHGVLWQRINPNLPRWWEAHAQSRYKTVDDASERG
jgi:hypothetical protein